MSKRLLKLGALAMFSAVCTVLSAWVMSYLVATEDCDVSQASLVERSGSLWRVSHYSKLGTAHANAVSIRPYVDPTSQPPLAKSLTPADEELLEKALRAERPNGREYVSAVVDSRGFPFPALSGEYVYVFDSDALVSNVMATFCWLHENEIIYSSLDWEYTIYGWRPEVPGFLADMAFYALMTAAVLRTHSSCRRAIHIANRRVLMSVAGVCLLLAIMSTIGMALFSYGTIAACETMPSGIWAREDVEAAGMQVLAYRDARAAVELIQIDTRKGIVRPGFESYPPDAEMAEVLLRGTRRLVPTQPGKCVVVWDWGWPWPALRAHVTFDEDVRIPTRWLSPWRPIPATFCLDILFYAACWMAMVAILYGPGCAIRTLRVRRGQCVKCGYIIIAPGKRCPECGWDRDDAIGASRIDGDRR